MAQFSKTLAARCDRDHRIHSYEADMDGHWVLLEKGYLTEMGGGRLLHEWTVADCLARFPDIIEDH